MRLFVVGLLALAALPSAAEAPEPRFRFGCDKDRLYVEITVPEAGVYTLVMPANACGPNI